MSDTIAAGVLSIGVDAQALITGFANIVNEAKKAEAAVTASAKKIDDSLSAPPKGGNERKKQFEEGTAALTRGVNSLRNEIAKLSLTEEEYRAFLLKTKGASDELVNALVKQYTAAKAAAEERRRLAAVELENANALKATQAAQAQAAAAANDYAKAMGMVGVTSGQAKNAMRQLPAQFTDIWVSLASGQQPLTVFLQQGGQIKDMFGGMGNATRALLSVFTPLRVALGAAAGAAVALGLAYKQGSAEADEYRKALVLTGNAAGETVAQLAAVARSVSGVVGTQGQAADALAQLAATGKIAAADMGKLAEAAIRLERVGGPAVKETVRAFADLAKDPTKAVAKLNEDTNFLTLSLYKQIAALQEQGKTAEAAKLAMDAFANAGIERGKELEKNLGSIERAWKSITGWIGKAKDALLDFGREDIGKRYTEVQRLLAIADAVPEGRQRDARMPEIQRLRAELAMLEQQMKAEGELAASKARTAEETKKGIKATEDAAEAAKKLAKERQKLIEQGRELVQALDLKDAGFNPNFISEMEKLKALQAAGGLSAGSLSRAIAELIEQQPFHIAAIKAEEKARKELQKVLDDEEDARNDAAKAAEKADAAADKRVEQINKETDALRDQIAELRYGKAAREQGIADRLQSQMQGLIDERNSIGDDPTNKRLLDIARELEAIEKLKKARLDLASAVTERDAAKEAEKVEKEAAKAAEKAAEEWNRTANDIRSSLTDAFRRAFESGEDFGTAFARVIEREIKSRIATALAGSLADLVMAAAGIQAAGGQGGTNYAQAGNTLSNLYSMGNTAYGYGQSLYGWYSGTAAAPWAATAGTGLTAQAGTYGTMLGSSTGFGAGTGMGGTGAGLSYNAGGTWTGLASNQAAAANTGTVTASTSSTSGLSAGTWGAIVAGVLRANYDYSQGFDKTGARKVGDNTYGLVGNYEADLANMLGKLGVADRWANLLSGATAVAALVGYSKPQISEQGVSGRITGGDFTGSAYADVTQKAGFLNKFFGGGDKTNTVTTEASQELGRFLDEAAKGILGKAKEYGEALGLPVDALAGVTKDIKVKLVQAADDTPEEVEKAFKANFEALNTALGGYGDALVAGFAEAVKPLAQYGETTVETINRVGQSIVGVNEVLDALGITALTASVDGGKAAVALQELFGGIGGLQQAASGYLQNYYTDAERASLTTQALSKTFAEYGAALPKTREEFRAMVTAQDLTTEAGRENFAALMGVADAFASITEPARSAADILAERQTLEQELITLQGDTVALRKLERDSIDATNLALYDQVQALKDVQRVADARNAALPKLLTPEQLTAREYGNIQVDLSKAGVKLDMAQIMGASKEQILAFAQAFEGVATNSADAKVAVWNAAGALAGLKDAAAESQRELDNTIEGLREKVRNPEQSRNAGYAKAQSDLSKFGINASVEQLMSASVEDILAGAEAFAVTADASLDAKSKVAGIASTLIDLKFASEDADGAIADLAESVRDKLRTPEQRTAASYSRVQSDLADAGIEVDLGRLLGMSAQQVLELAESVTAVSTTSDEAATAIWGAASTLIDIKQAATDADKALASMAESVRDKFRTPDQRTDAAYTRAQSALGEAGLKVDLSELIGASKEDILDLAESFNDVSSNSNEAKAAVWGVVSTLFDLKDAAEKADKELAGFRSSMGGSLVAGASDSTISAAGDKVGGLGNLQNLLDGMFSNFVPEAQQAALSAANISASLAKVGVTVPSTVAGLQKLGTDGFLGLVKAAVGSGNGAALGALLQVSSAFDSLQIAARSAADIASERASLEERLLTLQGDTVALRHREREAIDASNVALFDQVVALEDKKKSDDERAGLETQLLQLQGDTVALREQERATLQEGNRELYDRIKALEDEKRIGSERAGLETRLLQLQGNTTELRRREREALDPSNRALYDMITALEDLKAVAAGSTVSLSQLKSDLDSALGNIRSAVNEQQSLIRESYADLIEGARDLKTGVEDAMSGVEKAIDTERARLQQLHDDQVQAIADARNAVESAMQGLEAAVNTTIKSLQDTYEAERLVLEKQREAAEIALSAVEDAMNGVTSAVETERSRLQKLHDDQVQAIDTARNAVNSAMQALEDSVGTVVDGLREAYAAQVKVLDGQREAANEAYRSVEKSVRDQRKALDTERKTATDTYDIAAASLQGIIDSTGDTVSRLGGLNDALKDAVGAMLAQGADPATSRANAQEQIAAALATAQTTGALPELESLSGALGVLRQNASDQFGSRVDYLRDLYRTTNTLQALQDITGDQFDAAKGAYDVAVAQKEALDKAHKEHMDQLDKLRESLDSQLELANEARETELERIQLVQEGLAAALEAAIGEQNTILESAIGQFNAAMGIGTLGVSQAVADLGTAIAALQSTKSADAVIFEETGTDLKTAFASLDKILSDARQQYNDALGIDGSTVDLPTALADLTTAINTYESTQKPAVGAIEKLTTDFNLAVAAQNLILTTAMTEYKTAMGTTVLSVEGALTALGTAITAYEGTKDTIGTPESLGADLEAAFLVLDGVLEDARNQFNTAFGIDGGTVDLPTALANLATAIGLFTSSPTEDDLTTEMDGEIGKYEQIYKDALAQYNVLLGIDGNMSALERAISGFATAVENYKNGEVATGGTTGGGTGGDTGGLPIVIPDAPTYANKAQWDYYLKESDWKGRAGELAQSLAVQPIIDALFGGDFAKAASFYKEAVSYSPDQNFINENLVSQTGVDFLTLANLIKLNTGESALGDQLGQLTAAERLNQFRQTKSGVIYHAYGGNADDLKKYAGAFGLTQTEIELILGIARGTLGDIVPGFASGGLHAGGVRLVGEEGPELEVTGPARYYSADQTMSMLRDPNRREEALVAEIRALRAEVEGLRAEARSTATSSSKLVRLHDRWDNDGLPPERTP